MYPISLALFFKSTYLERVVLDFRYYQYNHYKHVIPLHFHYNYGSEVAIMGPLCCRNLVTTREPLRMRHSFELTSYPVLSPFIYGFHFYLFYSLDRQSLKNFSDYARYSANEIMEIFVAGTRIGQASECFVYWKDPMTNDTWGLNFTSPIDAKQFRECCVSIISSACLHFVYSPLEPAIYGESSPALLSFEALHPAVLLPLSLLVRGEKCK